MHKVMRGRDKANVFFDNIDECHYYWKYLGMDAMGGSCKIRTNPEIITTEDGIEFNLFDFHSHELGLKCEAAIVLPLSFFNKVRYFFEC